MPRMGSRTAGLCADIAAQVVCWPAHAPSSLRSPHSVLRTCCGMGFICHGKLAVFLTEHVNLLSGLCYDAGLDEGRRAPSWDATRVLGGIALTPDCQM